MSDNPGSSKGFEESRSNSDSIDQASGPRIENTSNFMVISNDSFESSEDTESDSNSERSYTLPGMGSNITGNLKYYAQQYSNARLTGDEATASETVKWINAIRRYQNLLELSPDEIDFVYLSIGPVNSVTADRTEPEDIHAIQIEINNAKHQYEFYLKINDFESARNMEKRIKDLKNKIDNQNTSSQKELGNLRRQYEFYTEIGDIDQIANISVKIHELKTKMENENKESIKRSMQHMAQLHSIYLQIGDLQEAAKVSHRLNVFSSKCKKESNVIDENELICHANDESDAQALSEEVNRKTEAAKDDLVHMKFCLLQNYFNCGKFYLQSNHYMQSLDSYDCALKLAYALNDIDDASKILFEMYKLYLAMKEKGNAVDKLQLYLEYAKIRNSYPDQLKAYDHLTKIFDDIGDDYERRRYRLLHQNTIRLMNDPSLMSGFEQELEQSVNTESTSNHTNGDSSNGLASMAENKDTSPKSIESPPTRSLIDRMQYNNYISSQQALPLRYREKLFEAEFNLDRARSLIDQKEFKLALKCLEKSMFYYREIGDSFGESKICFWLSEIYVQMDDLNEALKFAEYRKKLTITACDRKEYDAACQKIVEIKKLRNGKIKLKIISMLKKK